MTATRPEQDWFASALTYAGPTFTWDDDEHRHHRARLTALYFHVYGLDRHDAGYVPDTFAIVRPEDQSRLTGYRTSDLPIGYLNAVAVGEVENQLRYRRNDATYPDWNARKQRNTNVPDAINIKPFLKHIKADSFTT